MKLSSKQNVLSQYYAKDRVCTNPCNSILILWYGLVLADIIYWYVETTIMVFYGQQPWLSEMASIPMLVIDAIGIIILILDMVLQFKAGYIYQGAVIV